MEKNWDPGLKKFFVKILNSVSLGLLWMMACATAGIYFKLGYLNQKPVFYPVIFYTLMLLSLFLLLRYLYKIWQKE